MQICPIEAFLKTISIGNTLRFFLVQLKKSIPENFFFSLSLLNGNISGSFISCCK